MPINIPNTSSNIAKAAATLFNREDRARLIHLANQRRLGPDWKNSQKDWQPFEERLRSVGFDRNNLDHLLFFEAALGAADRQASK